MSTNCSPFEVLTGFRLTSFGEGPPNKYFVQTFVFISWKVGNIHLAECLDSVWWFPSHKTVCLNIHYVKVQPKRFNPIHHVVDNELWSPYHPIVMTCFTDSSILTDVPGLELPFPGHDKKAVGYHCLSYSHKFRYKLVIWNSIQTVMMSLLFLTGPVMGLLQLTMSLWRRSPQGTPILIDTPNFANWPSVQSRNIPLLRLVFLASVLLSFLALCPLKWCVHVV